MCVMNKRYIKWDSTKTVKSIKNKHQNCEIKQIQLVHIGPVRSIDISVISLISRSMCSWLLLCFWSWIIWSHIQVCRIYMHVATDDAKWYVTCIWWYTCCFVVFFYDLMACTTCGNKNNVCMLITYNPIELCIHHTQIFETERRILDSTPDWSMP